MREETKRGLDVAILGMGCRFPGARGFDAFARRLLEGHDAIVEVPNDRWDADAIYDPDLFEPLRASTRWGGFVEDVDRFDAGLFGIGASEAIAMDPQQRVLLETTWEALEHANVVPSELAGTRGGVWIAVSHNEYARRALTSVEGQNAYAAVGTELSMGANRISRWLGLAGPSVALNTGCSSSLVALDAACHALATGEVDVAIVGGVSLMLEPEATIALSQAWMMAADGRCKAFDARADGYVRSEGCGVVILRRAREATRALGIVRGSAVGYGSGASVTTPEPRAQAEVMRRALRESGLGPGDVGCIEAHGVGTRRGDAAELQALHEVYGGVASPCRLGSVKTNVGHLEWASGMPALARALVSLRGVVPPHLHLEAPSPDLALDGSRFVIPTEPTPWPDPHKVAAVSSFGLGGTLAHVIVEAWSSSENEVDSGVCEPSVALDTSNRANVPVHLLRISAADPESFRALAERYRVALAEGHVRLADLARTVAEARTTHALTRHLVARDEAEACALLATLEAPTKPKTSSAPKLALLFTGQGAQRAGMGAVLHAHEPVFRAALDRTDPTTRQTLLDPTRDVDATELTQPALFAFEVALAELLAAYGVRADAVIGHSVGEYAAACRAGMLDPAAGLALVRERGRLMGSLPRGGGMLAIVADEDDVAPHLARFGDRLSLAAVNAPGRIVCSGDDDALDELAAILDDDFVSTQRLRVSHAFHSAHMAPILDAFEAVASEVAFAPAEVPLARNLDGRLVTTMEPRTWRDALRGTVRFADGLRVLAADGITCFVEVGPTPTLAKLAKRTLAELEHGTFVATSDEADPLRALAQALATLADLGLPIDLVAYERARGGRLTTIPAYAFKRDRFWIERSAPQISQGDSMVRSPDGDAHVTPVARPGGRLESVNATPEPEALRALRALDPDARRRRLRASLRARLATVTSAALDGSTPFFELGVGSLALTQLRHELSTQLGPYAPTLAELFAHPTLDALARHLAARFDDALVEAAPQATSDAPIAIVGISLRLPGGAIDLSSFFDVLARATPLATPAPPDRFGAAPTDHFAAAWLDDVASFDAAHFAIPPDEARAMDPQHRLLLEASWHALEHAGRAIDRLEGSRTGVFFGLLANDYARLVEAAEGPSAYGLVGNLWSAAAGRVAHVLGLRGPALVVDTACSSSLVALHLAAQSLQRGECDLALAGGASVLLGREGFAALERSRALAPDGRSKTFAADADGYGRGEGVVVLTLARLDDAQRRGDRVLGVILGSGVAHDGRAAALTAPNGDAQRRLITETLARAGVLPEEVDFVECHGTGTPLGDPIEVDALASALGGVPREAPLVLGAAKAIIGHGEAAAGLSGVAKVLACLAARKLPGQPGCERLNPELALAQIPAVVPTSPRDWSPSVDRRRIAGVSAFGMSGTNAHVLVAEPLEHRPTKVSSTNPPERVLLALSARRPAALRALAESFVDRLEALEVPFADFAAASRSRRAQLSERLAVVARDEGGARAALRAWLAGEPHPAVFTNDTLASRAEITNKSDGLEELARAWVSHETSLEGEPAPHVELPRYPFARTRHWVAPRPELVPEEPAEEPATPSASASELPPSLARELVPVLVPEGTSPLARRVTSELTWLDDDTLTGPLGDAEELLHVVEERDATSAVARLAAVVRYATHHERPPLLIVLVEDLERDVVSAAVAGALRVVRDEHPELRARLLSVPRAERVLLDTLGSAATLPPELCRAHGRWWSSVITRDTRRPRARRLQGHEVLALETAQPGFLEEVVSTARPRAPRAPGEVRLRVDAIALSFLDAMLATGIRDDASGEGPLRHGPHGLGLEVRGVVLEADDLLVGTPVVALVPDGSASEVVVSRALVLPAEPHVLGHVLSELVAHEVFTHVAPWIGPGHRVLVQSATGAVGRAILHRARARGAIVLATAGDDARRRRLEDLLKVGDASQHVFASRDASWVEGVLAATEGEGVDLVVSSTAGDGLSLALDVLRDGGVVVDLNRRPSATCPPRPNRASVRLDVLALARSRPDRIAAGLSSLARHAESGDLPRTPRTEHPFRNLDRALRSLAHASHDGKVLVTLDASDALAIPTAWRAPEGTHLVTGGLGGLGLEVARWLVERGARRLALVGRRAPSAAAAATLESWRARGVEVRVFAADVACEAEVVALLAQLPDLAGVVHAAGSLDDGLAHTQTRARITPVLAGKLDGARHLDAHVPESTKYFVSFGSVAGSLGNVGQLGYAAANAGLVALAQARRARGAHALCVDWGPWAEVGMAADRVAAVTAHGARPLPAEVALAMLERALLADATHTLELDADLPKLVASMPALRPMVSELLVPHVRGGADLRALVERTGSARLTYAAEQIADLAQSVQRDGRRPGLDDAPTLDSLGAVELRERIRARFGVALAAASLLRSPPRAVARALLEAAGLAHDGGSSAEAPRALVALHRARRPVARLVCLPFAGGGPSVFREWPALLPDDVDVLAVELPGRGARHREEPLTRMHQVVDALLPELMRELDRPLVLFGHCMGALVAYELARALVARGGRVDRLLASACPGPRDYAVPARCPATERYARALGEDARWHPVHRHDDRQLAEVLRFLGFGPTRALLEDDELRRALLPTIRADFEVCGTYVHAHAGLLPVPLIVLGGDQDPFADPAEVARWAEVAGAGSELSIHPGDHYFLFPERDAVLSAVRRALGEASRPQRSGAFVGA